MSSSPVSRTPFKTRHRASKPSQPTPFREFIVKLAGICNIACDYCYVYEMADQSWAARPALMDEATADRAITRIAEHVAEHRPAEVNIILHGGEPLLAGPERIAAFASKARARVPESSRLCLRVQTNAIALTRPMLETLRQQGIHVGVSLDGDESGNDRHRRDRRGRGTYARSAAGTRLLATEYRDLFSGLLCTVDTRNDPVRTYTELLCFRPPAMDFLLPHGNWVARPPDRVADETVTPYGDWLVAVFNQWYRSAAGAPAVRLFDDIIGGLVGVASRGEQVGLSPAAFVVIDTDGSLQQVDILKSSYAGAPELGLDVFHNSLNDAMTHPDVLARQGGLSALAAECRGCRVVGVCGGGHYAHRFHPGQGFRARSVYCPDLLTLIGHVARTLRNELAPVGRG
jgi:uncharacterized protein